MKIVSYQPENLEDVHRLFYQTIHTVNSKDYSKQQLDVWAPKNPDWEKLQQRLSNAITLLAIVDNELAGFASLVNYNYLDFLYISHKHQGKKIAFKLCSHLEEIAIKHRSGVITTDASITARPFFEKFGFEVIRDQTVERNGISLNNFKMKKNL